MNPRGLSAPGRARLDDAMAGYVERGEMAGVVMLTCRRGDAHVQSIGAASLGGAPIRRDSIFASRR